MCFHRRKVLLAFAILALPACFSGPAAAASDSRKDFITTLTEENIEQFLEEVSAISTGQRPEMMDDEVENYFTNHIAEKSKFKSAVQFKIPGYPEQESEMEVDKEGYISSIVKGRYLLQDYKTDITLENLKIGNGGKSATFKSVLTETGKMPWTETPESAEDIEMIPITGKSVCEQRVIISFNNFIQMASADCETQISFDPFAGKPLVPE